MSNTPPPCVPAWRSFRIPHGRYPRLVLAYLTTEAVRRKGPDIELGSHFSHFCAALGIPPTTGPLEIDGRQARNERGLRSEGRQPGRNGRKRLVAHTGIEPVFQP
jgi:Plasmid encoded RepA protein